MTTMNVIANIDIPEIPPIEWSNDICIAVLLVCLAAGALMVWKGLSLSRWLLMLGGAGAGWGLSMLVVDQVDKVPWFVVSGAFAVVGGALGYLMARFLLALVAGGLAAVGVLHWIVSNDIAKFPDELKPQFHLPEDPTPLDWLQEFQRVCSDYIGTVWKEDSLVPLGILAAAAIIPVIFALLLKRWAVMLLTSLFGAVLLAFAFSLGAKVGGYTEDPTAFMMDPIVLCSILGGTVLGAGLQHVTSRKKPEAPTGAGQ